MRAMMRMKRTLTVNDARNPWAGIGRPAEGDVLSMRRVDETLAFDFYWGRDAESRSLLVLRHSPPSATISRLPHLRGVEILQRPPERDGRVALVIRLLDNALLEVFRELCLDIINVARRAETEADAVARTVARMWRWHHLLRGGRGLLGAEEQMGIIGELMVIERYLIPALGAANAVDAWRGPLGAAQDFKCGRLLVEAKSRASKAANTVGVSSEHQLDCSPEESLFLHLSEIDSAGREEEGFTLTEIVSRVRNQIVAGGGNGERFDGLLGAAGFDAEDDYSGYRWVGGERAIYRVTGNFPRLVPGVLPREVHEVRYRVELSACGEWLVSPAALHSCLTGQQEENGA
jgi:hypothetical protein